MTTNQTIDGVPLLPCPFCGGEPYGTHDHYVHDDLSPMPCVECRSCSAHLKAEDWNRRVQQDSPAPSDWELGLEDADGNELVTVRADEYAMLKGVDARYRWLQKSTPYRFKKIQDASVTDGGDVLYFHADRFDAAVDHAIAAGEQS